MLLQAIKSEGLAHYSYLVGDKDGAVVIDPRRDCEVYVEQAYAAGLPITHILETHRNEDYLIGSRELAARTGAEIWHADAQWDYRYGRPAQDSQEWRLGKLSLRAMHTPGHTPGHMSYLLHEHGGAPWMLFCGDTLFAGDVGRVDLLGMDRAEEMAGLLYDSIFGKILPLGDGVILAPAHGSGSACGSAIADRPWTTIGMERRLNARLQAGDRAEFITQTAKKLEYPPYFAHMERLNLEGPAILGRLPAPQPLPATAFAEATASSQVLDTRSELAFGAGHVPGALSIHSSSIGSFGGWFLTYDRPILLVCEPADVEPAVRDLVRMGFDDVQGYLAGGMNAWYAAGKESAGVGTLTVQDVCRQLDADVAPRILDVRSQHELETEGRIPDAQHIGLTHLPERMDEVPSDEPLDIFCGSGRRSMIAASLMQRAGRQNMRVVLGGFRGWTSVSCPIQQRG